MGFGIIIPVTPALLIELGEIDIPNASQIGGYLLFIYALMQFIFSPILGNLSDRYGRKPILVASLFFLALDYMLMFLAPTLAWLFLGRALAGMASATYPIANAIIADISHPDQRAQNFGLIGAGFGLGFIIGPVFGGVLADIGPRAPFLAAALIVLASGFLGILFMKESLPKESRRPFSLKRSNPVGSLIALKAYPIVLVMILATLLLRIAHDVNPAIWSFYTIEKFSWSPREVGYSLGFVGIMIVFAEGFLIRLAIPRLGKKNSMRIGFFLMGAGFLGIGLATSGWHIYFFSVLFALGGIGNNALKSVLSEQVAVNAQGELQGALASVGSISSMLAPILFTQMFASFSGNNAIFQFSGMPFVVAFFMVFAGVIIIEVGRNILKTPTTSN